MSFGWSGSDISLTQLAWKIVQGSRKACEDYDELTRKTLRLHAVLQRMGQELAKTDRLVNRAGGNSKEQLEGIVIDCDVVFEQVDKIVIAYAAPSEEKRSVCKTRQRVLFGNGQIPGL